MCNYKMCSVVLPSIQIQRSGGICKVPININQQLFKTRIDKYHVQGPQGCRLFLPLLCWITQVFCVFEAINTSHMQFDPPPKKTGHRPAPWYQVIRFTVLREHAKMRERAAQVDGDGDGFL